MKYIYALAIMAILLSTGACALTNNAPRHTAEEVTTIARSFNTECRVVVGVAEECG